ncbi:uncharacterized protein LOC132864615 isoform X1 [Neoarius graeffei]|uniref:uncharacterized protein LOC132864615 isoform X1 n=1 Tax=Neoarius graeffei TaxID=443677 RepID=UPI00298D4D3E|nr:uncharacterized protein LOC132864615 isoform X1 [Neoarius graeffei]
MSRSIAEVTGSLWGHCCVIDCYNGRRFLEQWMREDCSVHLRFKHNVGACTCPPPFLLLTFPTERQNPDARKEWIRRINRKDWKPDRKSRICLKHFAEDHPTAENPYPSLEMGYTSGSAFKKARPPPKTRIPPKVTQTAIPEPDEPVDQLHDSHICGASCMPSSTAIQSEHCYNATLNCERCTTLRKTIIRLTQKIMQDKHLHKPGLICLKFISTNKDVRLNTGLRSVEALEDLYQFLLPKLKQVSFWRGKKVHVISQKKRHSQVPAQTRPSTSTSMQG